MIFLMMKNFFSCVTLSSRIIYLFHITIIRNFLWKTKTNLSVLQISEWRKTILSILYESVGIPPLFKCDQGTLCDGMEGLRIPLKRFSYLCRYSDMIPIFGRPVPEIFIINNKVVDWIYENHGNRIMEWNHTILNPPAMQAYAAAVHNKGEALNNCIGFVHGTVRPICRPEKNQRAVYNGHKKFHAIKFQSVVIPNELIANLYGPVGK